MNPDTSDFRIRLAPAGQQSIQQALGLSDDGFASLSRRWADAAVGYTSRPFKEWSFGSHDIAARYIAAVLDEKRVRGVTRNFEIRSLAYTPIALPFANDSTRFDHLIRELFAGHLGLEVADIQREVFGTWTWVLTSDGSLWLHDKSHGCGGEFKLVPARKQ